MGGLEVTGMVFLFLFVLLVLVVCAVVVWPQAGGALPDAARPWRAPTGNGVGDAATRTAENPALGRRALPGRRRAPRGRAARDRAAWDQSGCEPAGWEGVLAAGRIRGEISQRDYVRAMELLVSGERSAGLPDRHRRGR